MSAGHCSPLVELRQYALKPGMRDALIELFDREFVESQEATGMKLIGQFRDADDPNRFVWLRGFVDMESRARSLGAFYGGPVWKANRDAANATMIDSDNVLLLRAAWSGSGFANAGTRGPRGATILPAGAITATICYFDTPVTEAVIDVFRGAALPRRETAAAKMLAAFVSEKSTNTFPALPIREGEHVFVSFSLHADICSAQEVPLPPDLECALARPPEILRLLPTARSRLHG
jgi:hypothetical protein